MRWFALAALLTAGRAQDSRADSAAGAKLFETLSCIECHSVNGRGGSIAPDLGKPIGRGFTPASFAALMWNHAPAMWSAMRQRGIRAGDLDEQAARDLLAYFYAARWFERPGDAARGKRLFSKQRCAHCHGLTAPIRPGIPPAARWSGLTDPIALVESMWNHASVMRIRLQSERIAPPRLSGQDLVDVLVYVRNLPAASGQLLRSTIETPGDGEGLLARSGCTACHPRGYASLARKVRGQGLTDLAAAMWDHAFVVAPGPPLDPAEMRKIISYFWMQELFENTGQALRGRRKFETTKRCGSCHNDASSGAPDLTQHAGQFDAATMISALWRHGPRMLERMQAKGARWPRFDGSEMQDLISYLNRRSAR